VVDVVLVLVDVDVLVLVVDVELVDELVVVVVGRQPFTNPQKVLFKDVTVDIAVRKAKARFSGHIASSILARASVVQSQVFVPVHGMFGPV
jgi:5,10-methylene-tetrahydrofolate dehydrogenase/methenyl tetrahydrofolate cyclohydrolase